MKELRTYENDYDYFEYRLKNYFCHEGNVYLFNIESNMIYAGGISRKANIHDVDLVIALDDSILNNIISLHNFERTEIENFCNLIKIPKIIHIPWRDMSIPSFDKDFYLKLIEYIKSLKNKKILICCIGGHGRTGTLVSIIAGLHFKIEKPISFIRKIYCKNAVETMEQVQYVNRICNIHEKASVKIKSYNLISDYNDFEDIEEDNFEYKENKKYKGIIEKLKEIREKLKGGC